MGLITDVGGAAEGYEAVSLPVPLEEPPGTHGLDGSVLRRRSARPTKRAVIYLHCMNDPFVPADLASWYTDRGFHFYVADLRRLGDPGRPAPDSRAEELAEYFEWLDAAARHVREADRIETVVLCAHATGALIAALWCHARRGSQPADALILASPSFGSGSWLVRAVAGSRVAAPALRRPPLLTVVRRRVRRGLDISCPVLVLCPSADWDAPGGTGGLLTLPVVAGGKATMRLGPHVTWLKLDGGQPGQPLPGGAAGKRVFDELGRWLSAYLSGQIRDQLL
ncbi:MAG TPA: alpha/beta hydrolase [Streptosporangiaceae bacterium]|nr:alpha/beta hydrolase [Streptosporangiaceae bacterium]